MQISKEREITQILKAINLLNKRNETDFLSFRASAILKRSPPIKVIMQFYEKDQWVKFTVPSSTIVRKCFGSKFLWCKWKKKVSLLA